MKNSRKIIIEVFNDIDDVSAINFIQAVIKQGKISNNKNGKHYSWVTSFGAENTKLTTVVTMGRKKNSNTDKFIIYKEKEYRENIHG